MARNIKARRKLSDLYARGVEVRFNAEGGHMGPFEEPAGEDEVAVWVAPPSPLQREMALRDANAARAKALLRLRRDEESEEYLTSRAFVAEMGDDTLVEYLLMHENERRQSEAMRDVLAQDEWKDFAALQDAMLQYESGELEADEEDADYQALMAADKRYGDQVNKRIEELYEADAEAMRILPRTTWEKRAVEKRGDLVGSQIFMVEYERQMTFYSVRDIEEHGVLFYDSAREWAGEDELIQQAVSDALVSFINEVGEAKNSQGVAPGSEQSVLPSEPETSESSTPEESSD